MEEDELKKFEGSDSDHFALGGGGLGAPVPEFHDSHLGRLNSRHEITVALASDRVQQTRDDRPWSKRIKLSKICLMRQ